MYVTTWLRDHLPGPIAPPRAPGAFPAHAARGSLVSSLSADQREGEHGGVAEQGLDDLDHGVLYL